MCYIEFMGLNEVTKLGSISIDDDVRFNYHVDVISLFGINLKAHMQGGYKLDDNWFIWFPKLYKNRDFINEMVSDGNTVSISMRQLPTSIIESDKSFPKDPRECFVFAHLIDPTTGAKYYKFVGVFTSLIGNIKFASCQRTATKLYFDGKGRFSTEPLIS